MWVSNNYQIYIPQDTFKSFAIFNLIDVGMTYFATTGTQNKKKRHRYQLQSVQEGKYFFKICSGNTQNFTTERSINVVYTGKI